MATVSANELSLEKTLEELITEFNSLRGDVSSVTLETLLTTASSTLTFEGATNDAYETSLTVVDPTADRTITLPNVSGTVITDANADTPATTSTFADLDQFLIADGGVLKKMALTTIVTSLPTLTPANADGSDLGSTAKEWSDLYLADSSIIYFGNDQDTTLTHTDGSGLTLNSTNKLMFNDASQFIQGASATVLDIAATDEIELTATLIDVVGNLTVSGTIVGAGALTAATSITVGSAVLLEAELELLDGLTAGTAIASKVVTTDASIDTTGQRNLTISGELDAATGDFSGAVDVAGATTTAAITASGIIKTDDTTAATSTTDGSLQTDGGLSVVLDAVIGDDIILLSDEAQIAFGVNSEITLAHVHNVGLTLTHVTADDNLPIVLQLKSQEDEILVNEVIGSIEFAAGDSDGTDGAGVAAGIHAIAEDTFSATANATKLVFTTGVSETAASSATAKATLSSIGDFTVAGDLVIKDGGTIGTATDPDAITIASAGAVTISQSLIVSGDLTVGGTTTQVNTVTMNAANALIFEGATADDHETTLTITDPTADRTITLPNETGTIHTSGGSIVIPNAANIGSAGDADSIAIAANGVVTFSQIPVMPANSILESYMAANSVDSDSYVDGSIDEVHMSANSIDSDSYVDGSIDTAHYADDSITEAKMANDSVGSAEMKTLSTLLIKNAAGSTLKTLHGAGA